MCSVKDATKNKDDYTVYGENVASRMRRANRSDRAVSLAKHYIDDVLFRLEMGELDEFYRSSYIFIDAFTMPLSAYVAKTVCNSRV